MTLRTQLTPYVTTVTIANGAATSGAVDLQGFQHLALYMPTSWTAASMTMLAAPTYGGTYQSVYNDAGVEVAFSAASSRTVSVVFVKEAIVPYRYVKFRSGTSGTPVLQAAERVITVIMK